MFSINLSSFGKRRRSFICRFLAVVITILLFFFLFAHTDATVTSLPMQHGVKDTLHDHFEQRQRNVLSDSLDHTDHHESVEPVTPSSSLKVRRIALEEISPHESRIDLEMQGRSKQIPVNAPYPGFLENFRETMALMPSNLAMKSLMEPFSNDGEEHLKDLAIRVRIYKTAFAAWETLHQSSSEGVIGKQNVVQLLRESQESVQNVNAAIQSYDNFRSFIGILGSRLFPGTKLLGDHLALHAGFRKAGRGMVLTFNEDQTHMVLTSIRSLRKLGSTMPVEVMYYGEGDLGQEYRELLEEIPGVVTRDMSTMVDDVGWELRGWALKPWAMLMSSFQEVLFMDADVLFFTNPETLFEDPQYLETGALFFKDRNLGREDKRKWLKKVLPLPISNKVKNNRLWTKESGHMQDSGVVLVDKWRHFVPLLLTARLNGIDRDTKGETGKKGVYEMVYGDKETFWLSWEMAGVLDYAFHDGSTGILGVLKQDDEDKSDDSDLNDGLSSGETHQSRKQTVESAQPRNYTSCSPQLLHLDAEDKPLWLNGWIAQSKFSAPTDLNIDSFEVFMKEPPRKDLSSKKEIWQLKQDNICCLTSGSFTEISDRDKQTLEMMISFAQEYVWEP